MKKLILFLSLTSMLLLGPSCADSNQLSINGANGVVQSQYIVFDVEI